MSQVLNGNDERAPNERPVTVVAPQRFAINSTTGSGSIPLYATDAWDATTSSAQRAVILLHGRLRNADAYYELALQARAAAGHAASDTLLIVPQFLAHADLGAHHLPMDTLHWDWTSWMGGDPALGPAPLSSFEVLDAILHQLASRTRFPALREVVIAGHSGGAQVVQRYAVVTRGEAALLQQALSVRYVVANPSSYVYFDALRPHDTGGFARFDAARCPHFNHWKYGLVQAPSYAGLDQPGITPANLEAAYAQRDVITLLGEQDCDPRHPALDLSCAAQAQGPNRLARGRAYTQYMKLRHTDSLRHRHFEIPGVGHDGVGIFTSPPGIAALFGSSLAS